MSDVRYARTPDGVSLAYRVIGDGPIDLVFVPGFVSHIEGWLDLPDAVRFFERLGSFARVILFDRRGQGLSDRPAQPPALEQGTDDVRAVMDAAGCERAALLAVSEGGPMSMLFAASFPERVRALVLWGTFARTLRTDGYEVGLTPERYARLCEEVEAGWGGPVLAGIFAPSRTDDAEFLAWWGRFLRQGSSPRGASDLLRLYEGIDVREVLPSIAVPALVLNRTDDRMTPPSWARVIAGAIPGARYVELPGSDHVIFTEDADEVLDEIEEFLTGTRHVREPDRVLATVMFTDIVGSTERAARLGDRDWRRLVERHDALVRREIDRFRGRPIKTLGDGFLATFDGPARAIRCARTLTEDVRELGIEIRAGLHTGELEAVNGDVAGMAVNIGARVSALAEAGEVLVSGTVRDLVVGSGIDFADRGTHSLKGVPGEWRVFAVDGAA
ncbi:MAG: adenylate/guanylate cyclase domain-containing protein [Actinomycetota bacterium]|nr:adenylate/guanylate cyclase domain-containing protein [Actinomycetota bacterium]